MDGAFSFFNSLLISNILRCSHFSSYLVNGPLKIPLFNNVSFSNLPKYCFMLSLLLIRLLWTIVSQLEINDKSTIYSFGYFNAFQILNTTCFPLTLITSSHLSTFVNIFLVARRGIPNRRSVFSLALKSIMMKFARNTKFSTLTDRSPFLHTFDHASGPYLSIR